MRSPARIPALALLAACCACGCRDGRPPAIRVGSECAACGMSIDDTRFACEGRRKADWKQYDSIECLLRDDKGDEIWLADYDSRALVSADSLWIVHGEFPSPMGGGLAAFRSRAAADRVAAETRGRVMRLAELPREAQR